MAKISIDMKARRADKRVDEPKIVTMINGKGISHDVDVLNIGRGGLRFRSKVQYTKGDRVVFGLKIADAESELSLRIKAKVVNVYEGASDMHEYGVRFFRLLYMYELGRIHDYVYSRGKENADS